jgi:hypothetical protein
LRWAFIPPLLLRQQVCKEIVAAHLLLPRKEKLGHPVRRSFPQNPLLPHLRLSVGMAEAIVAGLASERTLALTCQRVFTSVLGRPTI